MFDGRYVTAADVFPQPPCDRGCPEKAPAALVEEWRARSRHVTR